MADFNGGNVSADGGVLLLREVDVRTGLIDELAACFSDHRHPGLIEHTLPELLRQRVFGIAMGYEDLNDHDSLRRDPMMALGVGKVDPLGLDRSGIDRGRALAGKSTLNRLELTNAKTGPEPVRGVHKIPADHAAIERLLVRLAVSRLAPDTEEVVLDFDATDSLLHGGQEGRFFHGYYDAYCYLPLYCFIGPWPVWAQLRTSNRDASDGAVEALQAIVPAIRERLPEARVVLRADSGFAREAILSWCEANGVFYVTGLAKNAVLLRHLDPAMFRAKADACVRVGWRTRFREFEYRTAKSWSRARRVIGKAQISPKGENPRFIVTNLPADREPWQPERLYRELYCARGDMENRIKEQQLDLFADRMSCEAMSANQLRLWFSTFACLLLVDLRETGLRGGGYAKASPGTIRDHLLKIAAVVTVSVRRVLVRWSSGFRFRAEVAACWERLRAAPA